MAVDEKDKATTRQSTDLGAAKDILLGWLVGRALADLGFAQTLMESDAQRGELLKRLEESLRAQAHEVQGQASAGGQFVPADLEAIVDGLAERLSRIETAAQQASQARDQLQTHIARLQSDLARQQVLQEGRNLRAQELAESLGAKFRDLEERLQSQSPDRAVEQGEVADLKDDVERQLADLKARLERAELASRRVEAQTTETAQHLDQRIDASVRGMGDEIRRELHALASGKIDPADFQAEFSALGGRIAFAERAAQETAKRFGDEMGDLRRALTRQHERQQAAGELLKSLQDTLRAKFGEIENFLAEQQDIFLQRDAQAADLRAQMEQLAQRMADLESTAHHTRALLIHGNQQSEQRGETLRAEIDDLRNRLSEGPSLAGAMENLENQLAARTRELQSQLSEKMLVMARRDHEVHDLRGQIQTIQQRITQLEATNLAGQSAVRPPKEAIGALAETGAPAERPRVATPRSVSSLFGQQEHLLVEAGKDQMIQLHERISADIERARAELREKSGRWKARR